MKSLLLACIAFCMLSTNINAQCNTTNNLALGKLVTATSTQNAGTLPEYAVDGNPSTRWSSDFSDPQSITVDLGSITSLCDVTLLWESAYASSFQIDISNDNATWTTAATITGNTSTTNNIPVSGNARYVRMTGLTRATGFGYSLYEFKVYGSSATPTCAVNLALDQQAYASSQEGSGYSPDHAFDGDMGTRWSSAFTDNQYIYVDLGARYPICSVILAWEHASGSDFTIDFSDDALTWNTQATILGNTSYNDTIAVSGTARYVRMYGLTRTTSYGFSLWEMKVMGSSITLPVKWVSFAGNRDNDKIRLDWVTSNETGSARYEIQRKTAADVDFSTIGTVTSMNRSSGELHYNFSDNAPKEGVNYYRIKQVDINGHSSFSKTIGIEYKTSAASLTVYPNPVVSQLYVKDATQQIDFIRVFTTDGRKLQELSSIAKGQQVAIQFGGYPRGTYLVQIATAGNIETRKIVKE
jgi:hypothetical protein